jgi:CBS domain-containing protein
VNTAARRGPGTLLREIALPAAAVVPEDATLQDVAAVMVAAGISAVLVGDAHGIVTERDVVRAVARGERADAAAIDYSTDDPLLVVDTCPVIDALRIMLEYGVRNLIVVSEARAGSARLLNIAGAAAMVLEVNGLPQWLSGLRLALRVEMP